MPYLHMRLDSGLGKFSVKLCHPRIRLVNHFELRFQTLYVRSFIAQGRPVGTTIYPGMHLTAAGVWTLLDRMGMGMTLDEVCAMLPAWFGGLASILTGLLAAECSGVAAAAPLAALIMAVLPAHLLRSVGGGFDNESIAVSQMWSFPPLPHPPHPILFYGGVWVGDFNRSEDKTDKWIVMGEYKLVRVPFPPLVGINV